jgi:hypothetical protein
MDYSSKVRSTRSDLPLMDVSGSAIQDPRRPLYEDLLASPETFSGFVADQPLEKDAVQWRRFFLNLGGERG